MTPIIPAQVRPRVRKGERRDPVEHQSIGDSIGAGMLASKQDHV